jgi:hypothetical protein
MLRITPQVVIALLALSLPLPAWTDTEGYHFDCDVLPGRFSEWHGPIEPAETVRISGTVEVVSLRHDKRWRPVGSVFLRDLDGNRVGLQVSVDWRDTDIFQLNLYSGERKQIAEIPLTDENIPFELLLTRSGQLTATIAGHSQSTAIEYFDARRISLSCSSGQFTFRDVQVRFE